MVLEGHSLEERQSTVFAGSEAQAEVVGELHWTMSPQVLAGLDASAEWDGVGCA